MKRLSHILALSAVGLLLTGCSVYNNKYESKNECPADVFGTGTTLVSSEGASIAQLSWREFFSDPLLQRLIDTALVRNTDLNSARIAIEQSEASLRVARQAWLPAVTFAPSGGLARFGNISTSKTYNLPLQVNMDLDLGTFTTKRYAAEAALMQSRIAEEAVRSNLISSIAQQYNMLLLLDRELEILIATDSLWNASLETQKSLYENGQAYSTAVNQMESSYIGVKMQIIDARNHVRCTENAICRLLAIPPQPIPRGRWGNHPLPQRIATGVPAELLQLRPDIRLADYTLAAAFYNTEAARQAFYPSLSLSGTAGWTNDVGTVVNPGKLLLSAVASLTQPIFARGKLKANLKIAQLTEEDLQRQYVQTVIDAGNEVNNAIANCMAAREKQVCYQLQVAVLHSAYTGTHELMDNGKANYLEVLTAQESLLSAQLNEASNLYDANQALIALYIALGGATK